MKNERKLSLAVILTAGVLFLFAVACSDSPSAPTAVEDTTVLVGPVGPPQPTDTPGDTIPEPPPPRP